MVSLKKSLLSVGALLVVVAIWVSLIAVPNPESGNALHAVVPSGVLLAMLFLFYLYEEVVLAGICVDRERHNAKLTYLIGPELIQPIADITTDSRRMGESTFVRISIFSVDPRHHLGVLYLTHQ